MATVVFKRVRAGLRPVKCDLSTQSYRTELVRIVTDT